MIIGLVGKKGAGKTLVAELMKDKMSRLKSVNFKDALIQEMRFTMPDVLNELSEWYDMPIDDLFSKKPPLMRKLMQNYGTELRRNDDDRWWVEKYINECVDVLFSYADIVTDDVRFRNEYDTIVEMGGYLIRVVNEDLESSDTHSSEIDSDSFKCDYKISAKSGNHKSISKQIDRILIDIDEQERKDK